MKEFKDIQEDFVEDLNKQVKRQAHFIGGLGIFISLLIAKMSWGLGSYFTAGLIGWTAHLLFVTVLSYRESKGMRDAFKRADKDKVDN